MLTGRTRWPRARRILFLACLWLASVSCSIIVLEWVTGYLYERTPFSNGKRIIDLYLGQQPTVRSDVNGESASLASHPYLLYTHLPNLTTDGYQQTNSLGYRNREFTVAKPPDTIRILVLGGSTTFMWPFVKNPADTWVACLEAKLKTISKKTVQVVNAGLNYGTSAEALAGYVFRHRFLQPDIVIYHGGGNDVLPLLFGNYTPEYTHFRRYGAGEIPRPGEKFLLRHSSTAKYVYSRWLEPIGAVVVTEPFGKWIRKRRLNGYECRRPKGSDGISTCSCLRVNRPAQPWCCSVSCKREGRISARMQEPSKGSKRL